MRRGVRLARSHYESLKPWGESSTPTNSTYPFVIAQCGLRRTTPGLVSQAQFLFNSNITLILHKHGDSLCNRAGSLFAFFS